MKLFLFSVFMVLSFAAQSQAGNLRECKLYVHGHRVTDVVLFDVYNYDTEKPSATIDGSLFDFQKDNKTVTMSFSNECDNMYEITFSNEAIEKAKLGVYKTLIGKAEIALKDLEKTFDGVLRCTVAN